MTKVEEAIVEIDERLAVFELQNEGLRDYAGHNLQEATKREIQDANEDYNRRVSKLKATRAACVDLMEDGHPTLAQREVSLTALADLQANADSILAARSIFVSNAPTGVNLTAGAIEPKL